MCLDAPAEQHVPRTLKSQKSTNCPQTDSIGGLTREPERSSPFQTDQGDSTPGALPVTGINGQSTLIKLNNSLSDITQQQKQRICFHRSITSQYSFELS